MSALLALAAIVAAIVLEALISWLYRRPAYELRDTEVSLGLAFGWLIAGTLNSALALLAVSFAYDHRLADWGHFPGAPIAAFVLADLLYYVWHRLNHRLGWMWATHFVHHSVERINILAAFRQGWTDTLSGTFLTWAPLGLIGFPPEATAPYLLSLTLWQAFVHNGWTPRLGPLEWVLVTPSNHRVHHSVEAQHIDRNFGGVFIVWDRLFGTYSAEGPAPLTVFGIVDEDLSAAGPLEIIVRPWRRLFAGFRRPAGP